MSLKNYVFGIKAVRLSSSVLRPVNWPLFVERVIWLLRALLNLELRCSRFEGGQVSTKIMINGGGWETYNPKRF
jgi:hypothetical protein